MNIAASSFAALALLATACIAPPADPVEPDAELDAADDPAWLEATDPDVPAELEDASLEEDPAPLLDLVDDAADPGEPDELAEPPEPGEADLAAALAAAGQYRNPVGPSCADPGVVKIPGADGPTFWAACTGNGYPLFKSRDLVSWKAAGRIFSLKTKPKWAGGNPWAPEIHVIGDRLVAYFTALSPSRGRMCIGAARATKMEGPWEDIGRPLVCDARVSLIDATVHTDAATGKRYLYYKTDGNLQRS